MGNRQRCIEIAEFACTQAEETKNAWAFLCSMDRRKHLPLPIFKTTDNFANFTGKTKFAGKPVAVHMLLSRRVLPEKDNTHGLTRYEELCGYLTFSFNACCYRKEYWFERVNRKTKEECLISLLKNNASCEHILNQILKLAAASS